MRTSTAALAAILVVLPACSADDGAASTRTETVGPVSLEVPHDWSETDEPAADDVLAQRAWNPASGDAASLQVVVGCGDDDADDLTIGAARASRAPLVVTAAEDAARVEVAGLDKARRTVLTLGGGRPDDAEMARLAGLYGSGSGGLVLVELSSLVAAYDQDLADEVLESVTVDADALATACVGG